MIMKEHNTVNFAWYDYNPSVMSFVENWLDESAVEFTGLGDGFRTFYEYWANEDGCVILPNSDWIRNGFLCVSVWTTYGIILALKSTMSLISTINLPTVCGFRKR